ncbi:MAG: BatA domain-containing protein, partial [Kiloniellaceae bacterium]
MWTLGPFGFAQPWILLALAGLPLVWLLLRITPPAPRRLRFPAIRLLFGLRPPEETPARTPLWLIVLRMVVAALIIFGLAQPLLNPAARLSGSGPLVLVIDDGWSAARNWPARMAVLDSLLDQAERETRPVVVLATAADALE